MKCKYNLVLHGILVLGILFASFGTSSTLPVQAEAGNSQPDTLVGGSGYGDFRMISVDQGWVVLNNHLYWTSNGGNSWGLISGSIPGQSTIAAVDFINADEGRVLMVSSGGVDPIYNLAVTHDGGVIWTNYVLRLFQPGDFNAISDGIYMQWLDPLTGWLVIKRATGINFSMGSLFRTDDGGQTWNQLTIPIGEPVTFVTPQIGWVAGGAAGDELYQTMDGGQNWSSRAFVQSTGIASQQIAYLLPRFQDVGTGLLPVMFTDGNYVRMDFYTTGDGGQSWGLSYSTPLDGNVDLSVRPPLTMIDINQFYLVVPHSERIVIEQGPQQVISKYNRDGRSANLARISMASLDVGLGLYTAGNCFAEPGSIPNPDTEIKGNLSCSQAYQLLKTVDGGETWNPVAIPGLASVNPPSFSKMAMLSIPVPVSSPLISQRYSVDTLIGQGVDICDVPTASQLQAWWASSPYGVLNLYIGGSLRGCRNALLNSSLVAQLFQQGWRFIPTWVGPQAPCTSFRSRVSLDPATAYNQGVAEADAAETAAVNLGLTDPGGSNTIIYYDLEAYNTGDAGCRNAMKYFMDGWGSELGTFGIKSGVYGSVCASGLTDFASIAHVPDSIWFAWWNYTTYNPNAGVFGAPCMANSYWPNHQRIHQYSGSHDETWGGITINVDSNAMDGVLAVPYQGAANLAPNLPANPKPVYGALLPRVNDTWLYWSTNGSSCSVHIWGGNLDTTTSGNCASLYRGQMLPGAYSWQVTASNANGSTIGPVWSFNIRPYAPTGLSMGTVLSTQIDLGWTASADDPANLDGYDVYVNSQFIGNVPKGTVSLSVTGLSCNASYSFFLRSNWQNIQSTNSNTVTTTTGSCDGVISPTPTTTLTPTPTSTPTSTPLPNSLTKLSPTNNATGLSTSLALTWGPGSDVSYYLYCYDTINNNNCDRFWNATYSTSATIGGLTPGTTYYWEIVAVKPTGAVHVDNGTWWSFSVTGNPPTVTPGPSSTATPITPSTLTPTPTATMTSSLPSATPTLTPTSTTPSGLFGKTSPSNNATGLAGSLTFNWAAATGASYYIYCVDIVNNSSCDFSWTMSNSTAVTISGFTPGKIYYWEVVAVTPNGAIFADGGQWWNFSVSGSAPTVTPIPPTVTPITPSATPLSSATFTPTPTATQTVPGASPTPSPTATTGGPSSSFTKVSPAASSTGNPSSLSLNWVSITGATYYMYCYDTVNNSNCDTFWTISPQTNATISGLNPGTTYYWQVLAIVPPGSIFADNGTWWNFSISR